jgi:hypothetical protein
MHKLLVNVDGPAGLHTYGVVNINVVCIITQAPRFNFVYYSSVFELFGFNLFHNIKECECPLSTPTMHRVCIN